MPPPEFNPVLLTEHRDSRWLWPISAAASVSVHLLLLVLLGLVRLEIQPVMSGGKPIPIQLVDEGGTSDPGSGTPLTEEPVAPNQPETAVIDPTQAASNLEPAGDSTLTTEELPPPSDAGDLSATVPAQPGEDAIAPSPSLVPNAPPETSAAPSEERNRPATAGPLPGGNASSGNGQLVPLGIQADP
ncbi:MAG TPA: hypothetical protein V6D29_06100, partial [Leptolyngbyaceae cyanobacterium]